MDGKVAVEAHEPICHEPLHESLQKVQRHLDKSLADEVWSNAVHVAGLLSQEDRSLAREGEERRLCRAEHTRDAQHGGGACVGLKVVVSPVHKGRVQIFITDSEEDQAEDDGEEDRRAKTGSQCGLVTQGLSRLALRQLQKLDKEAFCRRRRRQRGLRVQLVLHGRPCLLLFRSKPLKLLLVGLLDSEHHKVRRVVLRRTDEAELLKMRPDARWRTLVGNAPRC
mmetsp:Transcript_2890/g.6645  ORF Transcript_2890/g.6645 Transcript_2890/m.6645 type:complete len:224 (+) Transcript_2890:492-1163(+)